MITEEQKRDCEIVRAYKQAMEGYKDPVPGQMAAVEQAVLKQCDCGHTRYIQALQAIQNMNHPYWKQRK